MRAGRAGTGFTAAAVLSATVACGATTDASRSGQRSSGATLSALSSATPTGPAWHQSAGTLDYDSAYTLTRELAAAGDRSRGPAESLVVVTVGAGVSVYGNPAGARPTPSHPVSHYVPHLIITRFAVHVERVLVGAAPSHGVWADGGVLGRDRVLGYQLPGLMTGQRALLSLGSPATDPTRGGLPQVLASSPVRGSLVFGTNYLGQATDDLAGVRVADTYTARHILGRRGADPPLPGHWVPLAAATKRANALRAARHLPPLAAP